MKKSGCFAFNVAFSIILLSMTTSVHATSWVEIDPQELVDRADVILVGEYDFTSEPSAGEFVFQGLAFHVKTVYRGTASEEETAGIDYNDVGWAKEFQEEGGEFLLFLERSKEADFLIPIRGANGMVLMLDGEVKDPDRERKQTFESFLQSHPGKTLGVDTVKHQWDEEERQTAIPYGVITAAAGIVLCFLFFLYKIKTGGKQNGPH
ncbi:hypothetical protein D3H55_14120 [Bacillus salacetis]|uniref:Uncharacterized protein n=1 Tax=Bacillus salacetis TaxID=2315464 RepID=A0A3A1QVK5_9BACI|nr:hypothetical protein [Bacillus salacetis]RIW32012.1 hypothetical protein D3H55_14120 [Bacillus salacetis]